MVAPKSNNPRSFAEFDAHLTYLSVGITVETVGPYLSSTGWEVSLDPAGNPIKRTRTSRYLGYGKVNDLWKLVIGNCDEHQEYDVRGHLHKDSHTGDDLIEEGEIELVPLHQASRQLRIEALRHIERLLTRINELAKEQIRAIEQASEIAKAL